MKLNVAGAALLSCLGLAACGGDGGKGIGTANANSPAQPPSGITASNGGGQRALGNIPNVGINSGTGTTVSGVPNTKGASY